MIRSISVTSEDSVKIVEGIWMRENDNTAANEINISCDFVPTKLYIYLYDTFDAKDVEEDTRITTSYLYEGSMSIAVTFDITSGEYSFVSERLSKPLLTLKDSVLNVTADMGVEFLLDHHYRWIAFA
jgi:hypothetical protein